MMSLLMTHVLCTYFDVDRDDKDSDGNHYACSGDNSNYIDMDGSSQSCESDDVLSSAQKTYLKEIVEDEAATFFEEALFVDPVDDSLVLKEGWPEDGFSCSPMPFVCCEPLLPDEHTTVGVQDTDFLVYVTRRPTGGTIRAWAMICQSDQEGRPVAMQLNVDPSRIDPDGGDRNENILTAKHEITHGLGFTADKFRELNIIDEFDINGKKVDRIVSENVADTAESFYDCPDWGVAAGGEIEDGGGDGTAGSHWEKRVLADVSRRASLKPPVEMNVDCLDNAGVYDRKIGAVHQSQ